MSEIELFETVTLFPLVAPLIDDECHFLEQLSDILKRSVSGEALSDSQKYMFSTEQPFDTEHADLDISVASARSAYDATEEQKDSMALEDVSEVRSCESTCLPPFN